MRALLRKVSPVVRRRAILTRSHRVRPTGGRPGPHVPHSDQPTLSESTAKVSDHVWEITGFPNIAIVVGTRATLVVDTGMGRTNGATVARVAATFAPKNSKLFPTTTHYHTEHVTGEPGFPPWTVLIRNAAQQQELEKDGQVLDEQDNPVHLRP
jgi:hypothetical protein